MSRRTALYRGYCDEPGVKITDFHGWELPLSFDGGIVAEHHAVRNAVGLFDVSHMGRILIEGRDAYEFVDRLFTNRVPKPGVGRCRYGVLCAEDGGCIDDVLVYGFDDRIVELVVNASNRDAVMDWLVHKNPLVDSGFVLPSITDITAETSQIALQGPRAGEVLERLGTTETRELKPYRFVRNVEIGGMETMCSRTGYTGEDGFEIYASADDALELWNLFREVGGRYGLALCGLGSRDTLRFEAGMPLYGQEISREITPVEAGLESFVKLEKGDFCGSEKLREMVEHGAPRRRVGLEMVERGVPRTGCEVLDSDGHVCGVVTSGGKCHTVSMFGAMGLVDSGARRERTFAIRIHGAAKQAEPRSLPFYSRRRD